MVHSDENFTLGSEQAPGRLFHPYQRKRLDYGVPKIHSPHTEAESNENKALFVADYRGFVQSQWIRSTLPESMKTFGCASTLKTLTGTALPLSFRLRCG
ncbi:hypothetical protein T265_12193 [Opisthorchis viverrini]|uniref:Uncharacterized protein n=1 Tax=Opisthorchis viverrini TaxID=6198 RepID=A0A074ZU19_OPIVI|nr:hypothetical protein T265_12193 [Opisthorchis viverrini]KER18684.1 hypothetical protein T265_12193 [Opisthorchis viverrini]